MKIAEIAIENFRALKSVRIPVQQFSVLIGENDTGKTSVLQALELFYSPVKLSLPDNGKWYTRKVSEPIEISVTFSNLPADESIREYIAEGKMTIMRRFPANASPVAFAIVGKKEHKLNKEFIDKWIPSSNFVYIPVQRDISDHFVMAKRAVLGGLLRKKMKEELENPGAADRVRQMADMLKSSVKKYESNMSKYLQQQALNQEIQLEFANLTVDPIEGVTFDPIITDKLSPDIPIANRGAGTQNNLIIALYRLAAEDKAAKDMIFALEEPENSLHPKAQRQLFTAIQELSEQSQTIITTHSSVFIDRGNYENNIWLTRQTTGQTRARPFNKAMLGKVRVDMGITPSEALLKGGGNCAIIVEGETEEAAFPIFMDMMGINVDSLGISVIRAKGGDKNKYFQVIDLMKAFGVPCVAALDGDKQGRDTYNALEKAKRNAEGLVNLVDIICLEEGKTMEDCYPTPIIVGVMNKHFTQDNPVDENSFDENKIGKDRFKDFEDAIERHKGGNASSFLKIKIGSDGTLAMKKQGMDVPDVLKNIFKRVKEIAESESAKR